MHTVYLSFGVACKAFLPILYTVCEESKSRRHAGVDMISIQLLFD